MIILIMIKFKYLATLQNIETHLSFITLDYVSILNVTFNVHVERIYNPIKWKVIGLTYRCQFLLYSLVLFIEIQKIRYYCVGGSIL